jgi:tRNA-dihydrouridine synthase A
MLDWRFSVAPMMGWTDRHERTFLRALSKRAVLYTEMIPEGALVHGHRERFLTFDPSQHPVALQIGGSDPELMAQGAKLGEAAGFDEININIGCPSERGSHRLFGAHLMKHPELVADVYQAMAESVSVPVTIKTRIGVDRDDAYEPFQKFVERQAEAGCRVFHVHARKAWLDGLSPKDNRHVPPLRYEYVYRLKKERPDLVITINGGIKTINECRHHLQHVDGVMLGREAYHNPFLLAEVDSALYGEARPEKPLTRDDFLDKIEPYIVSQLERGSTLHSMTRHLLGIYAGQPGARIWRRTLSEEGVQDGAGIEVLRKARRLLTETAREVREYQSKTAS